MAVQTFSKWCVILDYQVNKDFIAKTLCINRAKPMSCCQGKCHLNKSLAQDESQQQTPGKSGQRDETPFHLFSPKNLVPKPVFIEIASLHSTRYIDPATSQYLQSDFEPPQA